MAWMTLYFMREEQKKVRAVQNCWARILKLEKWYQYQKWYKGAGWVLCSGSNRLHNYAQNFSENKSVCVKFFFSLNCSHWLHYVWALLCNQVSNQKIWNMLFQQKSEIKRTWYPVLAITL